MQKNKYSLVSFRKFCAIARDTEPAFAVRR